MNRRLNIIKTSAFATALVLMTGCTGNFEDYNTNPFGPTPEQMLGDNVETGTLIKNMIPTIAQGQQNNSQMIDQMVGLEYGGQASMINPWGNNGNFYTYNPRLGWIGITFDTTMPQIYSNYFQIKDKTGGKGLVYAWAQILRVASSMKISDTYGPIPYSKVNGSSFTVAYDSMEDLYKNMFTDLDEAIAAIKAAVAAHADVSTLAAYDYIYAGNFNKWIKYANTLKLRMAMRIVNAAPQLAQQKAEEAVADNGGLMTEAGDAAYSSFNDGMNPMYRSGFTWNGGEFRLSANLVSFLSGYADPRLQAYCKDANGKYVGCRNGIKQSSSSFAAYQTATCKPNITENSKLLIMSAAEAYFLRAEGALRGWAMGGTAKDLYEMGVKTSMAEQNVAVGDYLTSDKTPADFVDPVNTKYNVKAMTTITPKWDEAASFETKLERIITQKWLASFLNGWEAWADVRRTGYPKFFPVADNLNSSVVSSSRGMRRLPFPQSEYNTNKPNVDAAVTMLGGADDAATDLWWAKKN